MLKFCWAVQADYFAWRIAENNLTGISGPHDNEEGLEDARLALCAMSVGQLSIRAGSARRVPAKAGGWPADRLRKARR
jgi:hypothetical protein